ncbi:MAG: hypothetical protein ACWGPN_13010, partial [Gammaproteobacteria bacterium]
SAASVSRWAVGASMPDTDEAVSAYLAVAATIGSDANMRAALLPTIQRDDLSDQHIAQIVGLAAAQIGSDANLGDLLNHFAARVGSSDVLALAYTNATRTIGSDAWARESLMRLGRDADLSADGWRMLLGAAQTIGSDAHCAELLVSIASAIPRDNETLAAYESVLATIGSDAHHRRAARALDQAA